MKQALLVPQLLLAATALLSGCATLYVPNTPSTPLLEKGQVEVTAGVRSFRYAEMGAAWSPINHVLLTGEVAGSNGSTTVTDAQGQTTKYEEGHGQGSVGVGLYRAPTASRRTYLAAVGGIGWGHTKFFAYDDYKPVSVFFPFPLPTRSGVYDARYRRYYGQVYFAGPADEKSHQVGGSLRAVWLDYTRLTYADQRIVPANRVFLEPSVFWRFGRGALRYYVTGGLSLPVYVDPANPANARTAAQSYLFGGGLILRPDLLRHRE